MIKLKKFSNIPNKRILNMARLKPKNYGFVKIVVWIAKRY